MLPTEVKRLRHSLQCIGYISFGLYLSMYSSTQGCGMNERWGSQRFDARTVHPHTPGICIHFYSKYFKHFLHCIKLATPTMARPEALLESAERVCVCVCLCVCVCVMIWPAGIFSVSSVEERRSCVFFSRTTKW